ncbi:MAG: CBS domain-containing protein [Bacteroidetes bacterium]|nr:CBS domain-containing protein [Bacteroidota bacterium]
MIQDFPIIKESDNIDRVSEVAFEFDVFHVPIVKGEKYVGLLPFDILSELDILEDKKILEFRNDLLPISIKESDFVFSAIKPIADMELTLMPVVDENEKLIGVIRNIDIIKYLSQTISLSEPGSFITLMVNQRDYNLQEISRIVESNNAKVLSLYLEPTNETDEMLVTLKIDRKIISHILATFNRFGYQYLAHSGFEEHNNDLLDRYRLLMKMMNI